MARPLKIPHVVVLVRELASNNDFRLTRHAAERMEERQINRAQVRRVLVNGHHEASKDDFDHGRKTWKYSFRYHDVDGRALRVVVAFHDGLSMWVVTAIDLDV